MTADALTAPRSLPPGVTGPAALPWLSRARARPLETFAALRDRYGEVFRVGLAGPLVQTVTTRPEAVEHVLAHHHKNYRKGIINAQFRLLDGEGLVTSEGDFWKRQRRLAQPAFHRGRLAGMGAVMAQAAEALLERWRPAAREGWALDVEPQMMRLTMEVAGRTLFGVDLSGFADQITPAVDVARDYITGRFYNPFAPAWLPTPGNLRFRAARRTLDDIVYSVIRERRASGDDRGDLLSMFMLARDEETGEGMSDLQLRDEVMTMLMAGHESTAVSLTWVFFVLGRYPDVQARLQAEVDQVLAGRAPGAGDLPALPYTRMVIEETMRLYPVVWGLSRQAVEEDAICGRRVPAGGYVTLLLYFIHRHPEFWEVPEEFDPERFTPERSEGRPAGAYAPFGAGPRGCIGRHFAMMEAQIVLASLAQRYTVRLVDDRPVELEPLLSLRPKGGLRVLLQERPPS